MIKRKKKSQEEIDKNREETEKMWEFFREIWRTRSHYSELSGTFLGYTPLTIYFHHIFKSRKFPDMKYDPDNIILVTWAEHQQAEGDEDRYEEINKRREILKTKYNL